MKTEIIKEPSPPLVHASSIGGCTLSHPVTGSSTSWCWYKLVKKEEIKKRVWRLERRPAQRPWSAEEWGGITSSDSALALSHIVSFRCCVNQSLEGDLARYSGIMEFEPRTRSAFSFSPFSRNSGWNPGWVPQPSDDQGMLPEEGKTTYQSEWRYCTLDIWMFSEQFEILEIAALFSFIFPNFSASHGTPLFADLEIFVISKPHTMFSSHECYEDKCLVTYIPQKNGLK